MEAPRNRKLPSLEVLLALVNEGLSNTQIGARYGASGEAVRQQLKMHGIIRDHGRTMHGEYMPWRVRSNHQNHILAKRLRAYSKRQQGTPLTEDEEKLLDQWIEYMSGANPTGAPLAVHYDINDADGFWLELQVPGDHDFIHPPE